jgi:hypothetical protein
MRGEVWVDPRKENPFRAVIEQRQRVKHTDDRTQLFLKVFANAGSYGIFVQMDRQETPKDKPEEVAVYGREGGFSCRTTAPEDPGNFCFPPIGAVITAAARLMLALLERCVSDAGGTHAFADTDSMAIVASREGGLVPCEGGAHQLDGRPAIRALSWSEVGAIVTRFEALNPYDRSAVRGPSDMRSSRSRPTGARWSRTRRTRIPSTAWGSSSTPSTPSWRIGSGSDRRGRGSSGRHWAGLGFSLPGAIRPR